MSTKDKLFEISKREFIERGYELASLRSIARQSSMATNNIYNYAKNKKDLFNQVIQASGYTEENRNEFPLERAMTIEKYLSRRGLLVKALSKLSNAEMDKLMEGV